MRTLKNILDLETFTMMCEKKASYSSCPWWHDIINFVIQSIHQDRTSSKENLREKAKNYASNYLANQPEASYIDKDCLKEEVADEIEKEMKDIHFDQRPLASLAAQNERNKVSKAPEDRYIKLGNKRNVL